MRYEFEVAVCGGGTAGAAAAIKAASLGAKTIVIEALSALGGTQSMGWVTPMMPNYLHGEQLSRGINLEIQNAHAEIVGARAFPNAQVWYNPTLLAVALDRLASAHGVTPLFNATVCDVDVQNKKILSVKVATPRGVLEIAADIFIDCTGDATLAALSNVNFQAGDSEGVNQPMTLRFTLGNVDIAEVGKFFGGEAVPNEEEFVSVGYADAKHGFLCGHIEKAIERGILCDDDLGYFQFFTVLGRPHELAFNCPRISGFDPLDPFSLSRAIVAGREKIMRIAAFCKEFLPGFENSYISVVAPLIGIRESRRILGEYVLTVDDHQSCRKFPDAIARNRYPIDIHLASGGIELRKLPADDYHEIPYRCLLPKEIDNLLVAGRCASADFVAQSSIRIQPVCRAAGEAAGAAAALCVKQNLLPRNVPYDELARHIDLSVG